MIDYLIIGVTIYFLFMFFVMPILVLKQNRMAGEYKLPPLAADKVERTTDEEFKAYEKDILKNGFRYVVSSQFTLQKTKTLFSLYVHDTKRLTILLTSIKNPDVNHLQYVEVAQLFDDDTLLSVMNSPMASVYPKTPRKVAFRYPKIKKISRLVKITEQILEEYLSTKKAVALPEGKELKLIERFFNEEQQELVERGYLSPQVVQTERMLTLKGAYLMTWKLLWPIKQIFSYLDLKHSQDVLKK